MTTPIEVVLTHLPSHRQVRPQGWVAQCPAHEDKSPSLSLSTGADAKVLMKCFAGCETEAIVQSMGLAMADLFDKPAPVPVSVRTVREWQIRDASGNVQAVHERVDQNGKKRFVWRRPDGQSGLGGRRVDTLPLYGTERLGDWPPDKVVLIVEGEKAADALLQVGKRALGTVTGADVAGRAPSRESLAVLAGRPVILWPDADAPGRRHMLEVAERLRETASSILWIEIPGAAPKTDAADVLGLASDPMAALQVVAQHLVDVPWPSPGEPQREAAVVRAEPGVGMRMIYLSDVQPEPVEWAWRHRIALRKANLLDGDPGLGKSSVALDLASRVTLGADMPDGTPGIGPAGVVICSAEDGLADTIRPRLEAAGADLTRIVSLTIADAGGDRSIAIPDDLQALEAAIERIAAKLVVIDPLMAHLPGTVNSYRDQDVRRALAPLAALAERTGAAILVIRHLNKGTGAPVLYRGGGSIGIIGAARTALLAAVDPDDETGARRVLAVMKSNLAPIAPSLGYSIETASIDGPTGPIETNRIRWGVVTGHTAAQLLATQVDEDERGPLDQAKDVLLEILGAGPIAAKEATAEAREAGVSGRTLDRAKAALGVMANRTGGFGSEGRWEWSLPPKYAKNPLSTPPPSNGVDSGSVALLAGTPRICPGCDHPHPVLTTCFECPECHHLDGMT